MNENGAKHLEELIRAKKDRLHRLELKEARYGLDVPPHIPIEIEELRDEIAGLQAQLAALEKEQKAASRLEEARRQAPTPAEPRRPVREKLLAALRDPVWQMVGAAVAVTTLGWGVYTFYAAGEDSGPTTPSPSPTQTATTVAMILTATDTPFPPTNTPTSTTSPTPTPVPPTVTPTCPPGMVFVPEDNEFTMGSTEAEVKNAENLCAEDNGGCTPGEFEHEKPQHKVDLGAFCIDKYEVTNAQYRMCVEAEEEEKCEMPAPCLEGEPTYGDASKEEHPVVCVDWYQADTYCRWAGKRLPTEAEWEKAARGTDGWVYPWENEEATCEYAVIKDSSGKGCGQDKTWPVGSKPSGASPYGAMDMAGNVWEWTASLWGEALSEPEFKYPYYPDDGREDPHAPTAVLRVFRGGSWKRTQSLARCAYRHRGGPGLRIDDVGFRCAWSP